MIEYLTEAVVLGVKPSRDYDRSVDLFTKEFGRLEARLVGGRKILSKLSPHLDIFSIATVRLIEKNRLIVTDALGLPDSRKKGISPEEIFKIISLVRSLTPKAMPDIHLWHVLVDSLKSGKGDIRKFLKVFGYDSAHAECSNCGRTPVAAFRTQDQSFFCDSCVLKMKSDELKYL